MNFSPAVWQWLQDERALPNTQMVCRRTIEIIGQVARATAWIFADGRIDALENKNRTSQTSGTNQLSVSISAPTVMVIEIK